MGKLFQEFLEEVRRTPSFWKMLDVSAKTVSHHSAESADFYFFLLIKSSDEKLLLV